MKKLELKDIQFEEKEMLKSLIKFFDENNIGYYIAYGTFLGAVRHKGFIPWDDDIDLYIARPEYNKIVDYIKKEGPYISENLKFIGYEIGESYFPFLKLVNLNIKIEEKERIDQNLWIDIFPLDGIPNNTSRFYRIHRFVKHMYNHIRLAHYDAYHPKINNLKRLIKYSFYKFLKIFDLDKITKKYMKHCLKYEYDDCKYVANVIWGFSSKKTDYIEKEKLVDEEYDFEDLKVKGIKDYDSVLSNSYGEYMKYPPKEEREPKHTFDAWRIKDDKENNKK